MILIDSLYINNSGGRILLNYLVDTLESENIETLYVFDERCRGGFDFIPESRRIYMSPSFAIRTLFYFKNRKRFTKVLCFGNIPPNLRLKSLVYTYFHQPMFLAVPKDFGFTKKIIFNIKKLILSLLKANSDFWLVQSELMKNNFLLRFNEGPEKVLVVPFYPPLSCNEKSMDRSCSYLYVSGGSPHKNHHRLIEAFSMFYSEKKIGELILTIDHNFTEIIDLINKKKKEGINIRNLGFVNRNDLVSEYQKAAYVIYPSLAESFGLGLIEGVENGCQIIGADLPYTYEVCEPSITFDPLNVNDIVLALEQSINQIVKPTKQVIANEIDKIITILRN